MAKNSSGAVREFLKSWLAPELTPLPIIPRLEPTVILMRGWPGSGKSTLARRIQSETIDYYQLWPNRARIVSADNWHINPFTGEYQWAAENVQFAHASCRRAFAEAIAKGWVMVIVDNTNIRKKDYEYYVDVAQKHGYKVLQAIPNNPDMWDIQKCFERNVHGVPLETIQRMRDTFEDDIRFERYVLPQPSQATLPNTAGSGSQDSVNC